MRLLFISKGRSDLGKWVNISRKILSIYGNKTDICIITGEIPDEKYEVDVKIIPCVYNGELNRRASQVLLEYSAYVSPSAYRSDIRFIFSSQKEEYLASEQVFLTKNALELILEFKPDFLFTAGAGTMVRTIFFAVAKSLGVKSYRILRGKHMNTGRKGKRYFFCDNDEGKISENHNRLFTHSPQVLEKYIVSFINEVKRKNHQFDKYARSTGRYWRVSKPGLGVITDIVRYTGHRLFKNDELSKKMLKYRFVCTLRSFYQKKYYTKPESLGNDFFLFPLNVPIDAQLRLRAKHYADSEGLIRLIGSNMPYGIDLAVKIHPGNPGMLDSRIIERILKTIPNVKFISPEVSMFELIKRSVGIFVINGNSALEAAVLGKPCVYLGDSYLSELPNCSCLKSFGELETMVSKLMRKNDWVNERKITKVLTKYYNCTYPIFTINGNGSDDDNHQHDVIASAIVRLIGNSK